MRLEDLKEQIQERVKDSWIKIQESSAFISIKEKYDDLTPNAQKILRTATLLCCVGFVFWILWGLFSTSSEKLEEFNSYQKSMQELARLKREMASAPRISSPPSPPALQQRVNVILKSSYLNSDQIDEVSLRDLATNALIQSPKGKIGNVQQKGVWVSLKTLNLKQITDIAFQLQNIHNAVKLMGLDMKTSDGYRNYYDVMYTIVGFYPPPDTDNNKKAPNLENNR